MYENMVVYFYLCCLGMNGNGKRDWFRIRLGVFRWIFAIFLCQSFMFCSSLNDEGLALLKLKESVVSDPLGALANWTDDREDDDPCSWFGVECLDGKVIVLNLKDLCLEGTLVSDLGNLSHIKAIILRNNFFNGRIPEGLGKLRELEFLDLGFNNFSGSIPDDLRINLSLSILLLDNNSFLGGLPPELYELQWVSESQVNENQLSKISQQISCSEISLLRNVAKDAPQRRLLQTRLAPSPSETNISISLSPPTPQNPSSPPPPESPLAPTSNTSSASEQDWNSSASSPSPLHSAPAPAPASSPVSSPSQTEITNLPTKSNASNKLHPGILAAIIVTIIFLLLSAFSLYLWKTKKLTRVRPWATDLSGQLQKAFVNGVPKLKRSELEAACENFSNVIGSSPIGTLYKGTLSSGVEITVASVGVKSAKYWSRNLEGNFKNKVDTLSKANHKNFISFLGYCQEEEPFTRMLVFEYAPNGTLFEHLYIREAEHLDWTARLRIVMGVAYCLEHLHQLNPPLVHNNLTSLSVNLTEDYAAKISELSFSNEIASSGWRSIGINHLHASTGGLGSSVYSFGVLLFEVMTGRILNSVDTDLVEDEIKAFLNGNQSLRELVDPSLVDFQMDQLEQIGEVIQLCVNSDLKRRPSMGEVSLKLRSITGITPDQAVPKLSPLWWAELEIMSAEEQ